MESIPRLPKTRSCPTPCPADRFLQPSSPADRRFEALRARFVDGCSRAGAAQIHGCGYDLGVLMRSLTGIGTPRTLQEQGLSLVLSVFSRIPA